MSIKHNLLICGLFTSIAPLPAFSAGFQLYEHSSAGLGRAFSGEGIIADTASSAYRNPASMTLYKNPTLSAGVILIKPNVSVDGVSLSTGATANASNIAPTETIPNLHFVYPINDSWAFGSSLTSNYGLSTKFDTDYIAGSLAGTTKLLSGNLNLALAHRFNDAFSFGVGVNAVYAKAKIIRHLGGEHPTVPLPLPNDTTLSYLKGNEWGYGWNVGLTYEHDKNNRFGLSYRSKVELDFEGDFNSALHPLSGGKTIPGELSLTLPDMWEFSGYHQITDDYAVHYSVNYTFWNKFKELRGTDPKTGTDFFFKDEQFSNSYRLSLGNTYKLNDNWTIRGGIAFDKRASKTHPSISIPDQDRIWLSAGATYMASANSSFDFGLTQLIGRTATFKETSPLGAPTWSFTGNGTAWLAGINYNYTF